MMILIAGTELDKVDLPFGNFIDYSIENNLENLKIKLKMSEKSSIYKKVYLNKKYIDIIEKINIEKTLFLDDKELLHLLNDSKGQKKESEVKIDENIDLAYDEIDISEVSNELNFSDIGGNIDSLRIKLKGLERTVEDKDSMLKNKNLEIETLIDEKAKIINVNNSDIELYKEKMELLQIDLNNGEKEVEQLRLEIYKLKEDNDSQIKNIDSLNSELQITHTTERNLTKSLREKEKENQDLKESIQELTNVIEKLKENENLIVENQKRQLEELATSSREKIQKANSVIEELTKELEYEKKRYTKRQLRFLKYEIMASKYNASSKEEFTEAEKNEISKIKSKFHIFATGTDSSLSNLVPELILLMEKKDLLVVDFSNDFYFKNAVFKVKDKEHSLLLDKDDINVETLVKKIGKSDYIATNIFNDIAFLNMDWINIIKKVKKYANGKDVIFLFNSISSFSVRHTVSKLASVGMLNVFINCNPIYLSNMLTILKFIPRERINLVIMQYIDITKSLVDILRKDYSLITFNDNIKWENLTL